MADKHIWSGSAEQHVRIINMQGEQNAQQMVLVWLNKSLSAHHICLWFGHPFLWMVYGKLYPGPRYWNSITVSWMLENDPCSRQPVSHTHVHARMHTHTKSEGESDTAGYAL